jgi:hypothetical protein
MAQRTTTKEDAMSTTATTTSFDLARFTRATEERDASTQLSMYAPQATVSITDRLAQPSSPRVLNGAEEIRGWIQEVTARDMTHAVQHTVADDGGAAFTVSCEYPDGAKVLCATVIELIDGAIARQTVVQVWDESN